MDRSGRWWPILRVWTLEQSPLHYPSQFLSSMRNHERRFLLSKVERVAGYSNVHLQRHEHGVPLLGHGLLGNGITS